MASNAAMSSVVTLWCAEVVCYTTDVFHSNNCCSDKHASSCWTFSRQWISIRFITSLLKKMNDRMLSIFGACCKLGRHPYITTAPSCCFLTKYCHLTTTLQSMSITDVNLQDKRAVFRICNTVSKFSFDSSSYVFLKFRSKLFSNIMYKRIFLKTNF